MSTSHPYSKKTQRAWTMYDWANSAYNLVITATLFPIYFKGATEVKEGETVVKNTITIFGKEIINTSLYDFALAFAYLLISLLMPLLSGIADSGGYKKRFMQFFTIIGSLSCAGLYWFTSDTVYLGLALAITACIGYTGSLVFYNAYLPEIAPPEDHDKLSARGFSLGYLGSSILLILSLAFLSNAAELGFMKDDGSPDKGAVIRIIFLAVGIWWLGWALIPFRYLPSNPYNKQRSGNIFTSGYTELLTVWHQMKEHAYLKRFLIAFFVYSMGVQTVMLVAAHFGATEIIYADGDKAGQNMGTSELITTILIIQFVAILGSWLFSKLSNLKGNLFTLRTAVLIWACICLGTYFFVFTPTHFYIVAASVGLVMGGIQAMSRSTYSKLLPETTDHASFFSFYDVTEKMSIVFGMLAFGIFNQYSGSMREPVLFLIVLFVIGFFLLFRVSGAVKGHKYVR